ncbi:MAG: M67 family metallopeptidase [Acidobacteriota bacterium]
MESVTLSGDAWRTIVRHAVEALPNECCGLLVGRGMRVVLAVRARNAREGPTRFLVHPEDHFAAIRLASNLGMVVIGAYHSHPASAPEPSATDLDESVDPSLIHAIVSLQAGTGSPDMAAYRICGDGFERLLLEREG